MNRILTVGVVASLTLASIGCGGDEGPALYDVTVDATLDGQPIPEGDVTFYGTTADDTPYAGKIVDGKSTFQSEAGNKRVEISSMQVVPGKKGPGGTPGDNEPADVIEEQIPPQYNRESTLNAEVKPDGDNTFKFDLESGTN